MAGIDLNRAQNLLDQGVLNRQQAAGNASNLLTESNIQNLLARKAAQDQLANTQLSGDLNIENTQEQGTQTRLNQNNLGGITRENATHQSALDTALQRVIGGLTQENTRISGANSVDNTLAALGIVTPRASERSSVPATNDPNKLLTDHLMSIIRNNNANAMHLGTSGGVFPVKDQPPATLDEILAGKQTVGTPRQVSVAKEQNSSQADTGQEVTTKGNVISLPGGTQIESPVQERTVKGSSSITTKGQNTEVDRGRHDEHFRQVFEGLKADGYIIDESTAQIKDGKLIVRANGPKGGGTIEIPIPD